ncbi:SHOCT domain-containing protein [Mycolicibacterium palauense]|uniref:SHOCT domain-containing protein n=1 Tax=Mycolicibacterium palauense TaxID=2034511 RepID=UPI001FE700E7|nr:SHOCT domain-containing protein [Mycolicibacterium palauense]
MYGWDGDNWMHHGGWMGYDGYGMGWGGWILTAVVTIAVIALIITAIVVAVRYLSGGQPQPGTTNQSHVHAAEAILAERLARGEIDDEEFRRRMAVLREHH